LPRRTEPFLTESTTALQNHREQLALKNALENLSVLREVPESELMDGLTKALT
jgi:hypothetical protein